MVLLTRQIIVVYGEADHGFYRAEVEGRRGLVPADKVEPASMDNFDF